MIEPHFDTVIPVSVEVEHGNDLHTAMWDGILEQAADEEIGKFRARNGIVYIQDKITCLGVDLRKAS
jgi:hypothetical protein